MTPEARIAYNVCLSVFVTFIAGLRFYVLRIARNRSPQTSITGVCCDIFVFIGWAIAISVLSLDTRTKVWNIQGRGRGFTLPILNVPIEHAEAALKELVFDEFAYICCLWCAKATFMCMYIGVAKHVPKFVRITIYLVTGFCLATFTFLMTAIGFWCRPFSRQWNYLDFCSTSMTLDFPIITISVHLAVDICILVVAILVLLSLRNLGPRERAAISFVILLGASSMIAACLRFYYTYKLKTNVDGKVKNFVFPPGVYLASTAECAIGLVAICLPAFRVLLARWLRPHGIGSELRNSVSHTKRQISDHDKSPGTFYISNDSYEQGYAMNSTYRAY